MTNSERPAGLEAAVQRLLAYFNDEEVTDWPCCSVLSGGKWHFGAVDKELAEALWGLRVEFVKAKGAEP